MNIFPKQVADFPMYIFYYWICLWSICILLLSLFLIGGLTSDGKYIAKTDCIKQSKSLSCIEYSKTYYVPVGIELSYSFVQTGFITGVPIVFIGFLLMYLKSRRLPLKRE